MWVICGGVNNTDNDETWYSADGISWHELKNPKYAARHAASVATHDDALWLMTGIASNDCWRLRNVTAAPTVFNEPFAERPRIHPNPTLGAVTAPFDVIRATVRTTSGSVLAVPFAGRTLDLSALPAGIYVLSLVLRDASRMNERVVKY